MPSPPSAGAAAFVQELAATSAQQALDVADIEQSMKHVDELTQRNAAAAEEFVHPFVARITERSAESRKDVEELVNAQVAVQLARLPPARTIWWSAGRSSRPAKAICRPGR